MIPYFYRDKEGREIGPFDLVTLSKFRMAGVLDGDTPVRTADSAEWKPCREVIANSPTISAAPITKEPIKKSSNGILIALIAIVIVVIIATRSRTQHATEGLGSEDWGNSGDIPVKKTTGDTTINPLDKEAVKQALDYWKLTKLGQSHYLHMINRSSDNMNKERTVYELRNVELNFGPMISMKRTNSTGWSGEEQSRFVLFRAPIVHREREIHGQEEQSHQTKRGRNGANFRWGVKNYYGKPTVSGAILGTFAPRSSKLSGPTFRHLAQHQRLIPGRGNSTR